MNSPFRKDQPLPKLSTATFPKRWLYFDTETHYVKGTKDGNPMDFKLGYAIYVEYKKDGTVYKRQEYTLTHIEEFLQILHSLDKKKKKLMVVAHNIKFDIQVLDVPFSLFKSGIETNPPIINGMTFLWTIKLGNGSTQFIDSANFVPVSLEKIGKDLGFPKMEIDLDNCTYDELMTYCRNDVLVLEKFVTEFLRFLYLNDLGSFRSTLASQAMSTFRYKFLKNQPYVHCYQPSLDLARKAYYGGRTECFFIGTKVNEELFYVDINSAYPFAMSADDLPIQLIMHRKDPNLYMLNYHVERNYVIADVTLSTNAKAFPFRLTKDIIDDNKSFNPNKVDKLKEMNGKLIFPIGEYRTVLHQCELEFALKYDMVLECHEYSVYSKGAVFKEYVDFFYKMKQKASIEHNATNRLMSKLFLNSLYGKFGQRYHDMQLVDDLMTTESHFETVIDIDTMISYIQVTWFGKVYNDMTSGESTYSIPSLAGAITAKGRMHLFNYIVKAGMENCFYCDTDSLIVNYMGFCNLTDEIDDLRLGALGLEARSRFVEIRNNKDYSFGEYDKVKGVPKNAIQISADEWQYEWFEGIKTWRKRGAKGSPLIYLRRKKRKTKYNKGKVLADGTVTPFILDGIEITNL